MATGEAMTKWMIGAGLAVAICCGAAKVVLAMNSTCGDFFQGCIDAGGTTEDCLARACSPGGGGGGVGVAAGAAALLPVVNVRLV